MQPDNPEQLREFLRRLPAFLEGLRAQEFKVGTRQHIAVQELVGAMIGRGALPPTFADFGDWLAPLVCTTRYEQDDFRQHFRRWLIDNDFAAEVPKAVEPPPGENKEEPPGEDKKTDAPTEPTRQPPPSLLTGRTALLLAAGAAFVALAVLLAWRPGPAREWLSGLFPTPTPVAPATPSPTPTTTPTATPTATPTTTPTPQRAPEQQQVTYAYDLAEQPGPGTVSEGVEGVVPDDDPLPPETLWEKIYPLARPVVAAAPFVWLGVWWYRRRRLRREQKERWKPGKRPRLDKIKAPALRETRSIYEGAGLRRLARELRRHRRLAAAHLDARATVMATVRHAGLFTPAYGSRRALPEYLALVERANFADQLARLNSEAVARLDANDVYLDTYYFKGEPTLCREARDESNLFSLQDLAARHPEHYLLLFTDGQGLIDPRTGGPRDLVAQLAFWRGATMLTPVPRSQWGRREAALIKSGLTLLPLGPEGWRALAEVVNSGAQPRRQPSAPAPSYPSILEEQHDLWKEPAAPAAHHSARLLSQLRRYLGPEGYELLCACAAYPLLQWGVTVYLASEMLPPGRVEETVRALVRLPWFRHGTMPEWLRRLLIGELPDDRRHFVRERLELLLVGFIEGAGNESAAETAATTAVAAAAPARGLRHRLEVRRRRRRLRRLIEHAPPRSPVSEHVFVNFINNNGPAILLPLGLRRFLFRRGVVAYGPRGGPAAAAAALLAVSALSLVMLAQPTPPAANVVKWPDDLCRYLCPRQSGTPVSEAFAYTPSAGQRGRSYPLRVSAAKPGPYDFTRMTLRPAPGSGLTVGPPRATSDALNKTLTVAPDAPLGQTELALYDGDQLRARLPFTISDAPPARCPNVYVSMSVGGPSLDATRFEFMAEMDDAPPGRRLTYMWTTSAGRISAGQGTQRITVDMGQGRNLASPSVTVTVAGLDAPCSALSGMRAPIPLEPKITAINVSPRAVTVCRDDPGQVSLSDGIVRVRIIAPPLGNPLIYEFQMMNAPDDKVTISYDRDKPDATIDFSRAKPGEYTIRAIIYDRNAPALSISPETSTFDEKTFTIRVVGCGAETGASVQPNPGGMGNLVVRLVNETGEPELVLSKIRVHLIRTVTYSSPNSRAYKVGVPSADGSVVFNSIPSESYICVLKSQLYDEAVVGEVYVYATQNNTVDLRVRRRAPN